MVKNNKHYDEEYFLKRDVLPIHFLEIFSLLLKELPVRKILDVGCGTGVLVKYLNINDYQATGCDSSDTAVRISGQIKGSATNLPFKDETFDMVTAVSLIEHLTADQADKFLDETKRVLRPKGYLFLVTPNLFSLLKPFMGKNWFAYTDPTHINLYSPLTMKKLLHKHHFRKEQFCFRVDTKTPADWFFAQSSLNQFGQYLINVINFSSPLGYFRESFWVLSQKQ